MDLFGLVIKRVFQLTYHNYVSAVSGAVALNPPPSSPHTPEEYGCKKLKALSESSSKMPNQNQMGTHMSGVTSQLRGLGGGESYLRL